MITNPTSKTVPSHSLGKMLEELQISFCLRQQSIIRNTEIFHGIKMAIKLQRKAGEELLLENSGKLVMQHARLIFMLCYREWHRQAFSVPVTWRILPHYSFTQLTQDVEI